ncbi:thioredoxin family protein [Rhodanobacter glycinis]|uniref:Thioredoxin family protein n=2 Tax=Rhodanobacter glycinis TaxID=582702 RepID=A0A502BUW9_9GAMM|nr:thioredoxin family protein [Rhodanobacter glycinis]
MQTCHWCARRVSVPLPVRGVNVMKQLLLFIGLLLGSAAGGAGASVTPAHPPEFAGISQWINSPPLTLAGLRGKVVLIDFWAYSCINCLRAMPHVEHLYETYKDKGLVVIGVHSPEFDFEKDLANVKDAVTRLGITYPVATDNHLGTWNAWQNLYWPAEYLIDQNGNLIGHHYGEGDYLKMENAIRLLLGMNLLPENGSAGNSAAGAVVASPEMYIGSAKQKNLASPETGHNGTRHFSIPARLAMNRFALSGVWEISDKYAQLASAHGELQLHFKAGKLHMVASSEQPTPLEIVVDGKLQPTITVQTSRLYTLFDSDDYREHSLTLRIPQAGLQIYTFTFG